MNLIETGIGQGLIKFDEDRNFITYIHQNKKRNYNNPEEKVQAETFLTLVLIYGYPEKRIKQFVSVQMGSETKEADLIVYNDDKHEETLILVECKKEAKKKLEKEAKKKNSSFNKKDINELIKDDKPKIQNEFKDKVNFLKEELAEKYLTAKQITLDDYPIFMAIAEDIGYDATGRETQNNELTEIGKELSKFINRINETEV